MRFHFIKASIWLLDNEVNSRQNCRSCSVSKLQSGRGSSVHGHSLPYRLTSMIYLIIYLQKSKSKSIPFQVSLPLVTLIRYTSTPSFLNVNKFVIGIVKCFKGTKRCLKYVKRISWKGRINLTSSRFLSQISCRTALTHICV